MKTQLNALKCSVFLAALFLAVTLTNTLEAKTKTYELKLQCQYPERHYSVQNVLLPWIKRVEEKSEGRLKIHFFTQRSIVKEEETYDAVKNGLLDIGTASTGRTPGKFPLMDIVSIPMLFPNAEIASSALWDLYESSPEMQAEFKDTFPLWFWTTPPVQINTIKKPVKTLEDMKGLKLIGWIPPFLNLNKALGANPIQLPPMDTYLSLERGMADGISCPYPILRPFKITEVAKHHTTANLMSLAFFATMNERKFKRLPEDLQKILLEETGKQMSSALGKSLDESAKQDMAWMKENGHEFYNLAEEEKKRWADAVLPLREKWLSTMESKGKANIREMVKKLETSISEYSK